MGAEGFVKYLNSLHNYNAQNKNAYAEVNVNNEYYDEVMVKMGVSDFILAKFKNEDPHLIILTGHAGDGKTSIMHQVLKSEGLSFKSSEHIFDGALSNGKKLYCIKDFSEIDEEERGDLFKRAIEYVNKGSFVFLVGNTGPLINTFGKLFTTSEEREKAEIQLVEAIDESSGKLIEIMNIKLCVINVASIDNTYFPVEFLSNIIKNNAWAQCATCKRNESCHILKNKEIIYDSHESVYSFLTKHYIWLVEHGKRLTIRSMAAQIAYMITGGFECNQPAPKDEYKMLFPNLFFGYIGTVPNPKALNIPAVKEARECKYDEKRLCSDEHFLIDREIVFPKRLDDIISNVSPNVPNKSGWDKLLRRLYYFCNIENDETIKENNIADVFSKRFSSYLSYRSGEKNPGKKETELICEALSMIYLGERTDKDYIYVTLSKDSGIAQNVQASIGKINKDSIKVKAYLNNKSFDDKHKRYSLYIEVNKQRLKTELSLPLLNYFEDLKNGIISTNIDPLLSYGIESLKAELTKMVEGSNEDGEMQILILRNNKTKCIDLEIDKETDKIELK